jgi:hypothetical protein
LKKGWAEETYEEGNAGVLGVLEELDERVEGGLGVQGIEDGFDQQNVGSTVVQTLGLLCVGFDQLLEGCSQIR